MPLKTKCPTKSTYISNVSTTCVISAGKIIGMTSEPTKCSIYRRLLHACTAVEPTQAGRCVAVEILQTKCSLLSRLLKPQVFALTEFVFVKIAQKPHIELWVVLSNRNIAPCMTYK